MKYDAMDMFNNIFSITFKNATFRQYVENIFHFLTKYIPLSSVGLYEFNTNMITKIALYTYNEEFCSTPDVVHIDKDLLRRMYMDQSVTGRLFCPQILSADSGHTYCSVFKKVHPKGGTSIYIPLKCENDFNKIFHLSVYNLGKSSYTEEALQLCEEIWPALNGAFSEILQKEQWASLPALSKATVSVEGPTPGGDCSGPAARPIRFESLNEHMAAYIRRVIIHTEGRISGPDGAAVLLGVPSSTLWSKLRKLNIRITRNKQS